MNKRKKKLLIAQSILFVFGAIIIFFTYLNKKDSIDRKIISEKKQIELKKQLLEKENDNRDVFYNIEYSGLDLSGNRYILKSKEAFTQENNTEIIDLKFVEAIFYLKDGTILTVGSDTGVYNNKTLDMIFIGNVSADYNNSKLYADRANYSNQKSSLIVSKNVIINDSKGRMFADKLFFDIKNQTLDISSSNKNRVNTKINIK